MTDRLLCSVCVATRGVTIGDAFDSEEALAEHIEQEHGYEPSLVEAVAKLQRALRGENR